MSTTVHEREVEREREGRRVGEKEEEGRENLTQCILFFLSLSNTVYLL